MHLKSGKIISTLVVATQAEQEEEGFPFPAAAAVRRVTRYRSTSSARAEMLLFFPANVWRQAFPVTVQ